jgi:hypothetical protein
LVPNTRKSVQQVQRLSRQTDMLMTSQVGVAFQHSFLARSVQQAIEAFNELAMSPVRLALWEGKALYNFVCAIVIIA